MDTSESTDPRVRRGWARCGDPAFTLVEVTLSIGIMAFALLAVFGLLPIGMNTFRTAINTTIGGQIAQRVINDAQQTDFDQLITDSSGTTITVSGTKAVRYFSEQGDEVIPANPTALTAAEQQHILYWVNTRIVPATSQPSNAASPQSNADVATITVQVMSNPAGQPLAYTTPTDGTQTTYLWSGAYLNSPANSISLPITRSIFVARNQ